MKIYLSYRSLDRETIRSLVSDLQNIGHEVWTDHHSATAYWWDNILEGIRGCHVFIFGLNEGWFETESCQREFAYATTLNKPRLGVKLAQVAIDELPSMVRQVQIIDYRDTRQSELQFLELQRAINRIPIPVPLPDLLPEVPEPPAQYFSEVDYQLKRLHLAEEAQTAMVKNLKSLVRRKENAERARVLLEQLQKHPDTTTEVIETVHETLKGGRIRETRIVMTDEILPPLPEVLTRSTRPPILPELWGQVIYLKTLNLHTDTVHRVRFHPKRPLLASASGDGTVRLWHTDKGEPFALLNGHEGVVRDVAWSSDGKMLASAGTDTEIRVWHIEGSREVIRLRGHEDWVLRTCFSPHQDILATSSTNEITMFWKLSTSEAIQTLGGHSGWVTALEFSPDGTLFVTGSHDGTVQLWNAPRRKRIHILRFGGVVEDVAFSSFGTTLAVALRDGTIRLINVPKQEEFSILKGHRGAVTSVQFSKDRLTLVSGGDDGTIRVWDMSTLQEQYQLPAHQGAVLSLSISPYNDLIASSSDDGTIKLWGLV